MQRLVKNRIFTLIVCILLTMFAVLLVIDNLGLIGERYIAFHVIHVLTAVALIVYVVLALCPMVPRYKNNSGRIFLLVEIAVLLVTAVAQIGVELFRDLPILSDLQVWAVLGLAVWLRATVLTIRAYLLQGAVPAVPLVAEAEVKEPSATPVAPAEPAEGAAPLWRVCLYLLLSAVGVWQIARPVDDKYFIYGLIGATAVFATIFAVFTVQNQRVWREAHPKKVKTPEPVVPVTENDPAQNLPAVEPAPAEAQVEAPAADRTVNTTEA